MAMLSLKTHLDAHRFTLLLEQKVDPSVCVTELVRCNNAAGKPFYAYIRIKPSEYMQYRYKLEQGERIDPNHYEIIEYGWGANPPEHVCRAMEEKYGVDHNFEKALPKPQHVADDLVAG